MKPRVIVLDDSNDTFRWMSDGWYQLHQHGLPEAEELFTKARSCIDAADDAADAISRLEEAGFEVVRA